MEDFSEAEQAEAYAEAFPDAAAGSGGRRAAGRPTQRARLISRQLDALRWLETHVAQDPRASDSVTAWLNPAVGARLVQSGLSTLSLLVTHINLRGARWWCSVPGVGALKAGRVVEWLRAQEPVTGLRVGAHAVVPRGQAPGALLDAVVPPGAAMVPWEKFRLPADLDGRDGHFRAPAGRCLLSASNDYEAIAAWLAAKSGGRADGPLGATARAYRKEAERLLLWSVLVRRKEVSSLSIDDALAYREFVASPPRGWCGLRHLQRWSPEWRPFEGPLSLSAQRHAMTVLRGMFGFLVAQGYIMGNPFAAATLRPTVATSNEGREVLTEAQWATLDDRLAGLAGTPAARRAVRAVRWLYGTGLRLPEAAAARCGQLTRVPYLDVKGCPQAGWFLQVEGQGRRHRRVPVPAALVAELKQELMSYGVVDDFCSPTVGALPIFGRFEAGSASPLTSSASGLAKAIQTVMGRAAEKPDGEILGQLGRVSAKLMRRTSAVHMLQGGVGRPPAPLQIVQRAMGHASLLTTVAYLPSEQPGSSFVVASYRDGDIWRA